MPSLGVSNTTSTWINLSMFLMILLTDCWDLSSPESGSTLILQIFNPLLTCHLWIPCGSCMVCFLCHFIMYYSMIVHGIFCLLHSNVPFIWDEHAPYYFDALNLALTSPTLINLQNSWRISPFTCHDLIIRKFFKDP